MVSLRRRQVIIGGMASTVVPHLAFASFAAEQHGKLVLSGRILSESGKPISGAMVSVGQDQTTSDGDGRFVLTTTSGKAYHVNFSDRTAQGFVSDARRDRDGTWRASFGLTLA
jgi:hypothetical protein